MTQATTAGEQVADLSRQSTRKFKVDDELQITWGEVYVPGFPDSQGDFMTSAEVRRMSYAFAAKGDFCSCIDVNHVGRTYKAEIVETFIARKGDPDFIEGSWVVGIHIDDAGLWARVKKGELNGLSMEALVTSIPVELDIDVPEIIRGLTIKSDGHQHEYRVQLDASCGIIGGETNFVDGHKHVIKRGTVTEEGGNPSHRHRFSFLDELSLAA